MHSSIGKYLAEWAEPESQLPPFDNHAYQHCAVIPLHREVMEDIQRLETSLHKAARREGERLLVIWVINGCSDDPPEHEKVNRFACRAITGGIHETIKEGILLLPQNHFIDYLIVDRFSEQRKFPTKEGVGLARKIGGDIALSLHSKNLIQNGYFLTTDADVEVPADFFQKEHPPCAAVVLPFKHDTAHSTGLALYDIWLRYYRLMLQSAQSPYAFFTIGSTLKISFEAYAMVRGFPKLNAGEDFYILNKLKKIADVKECGGLPLFIHDRNSDRVPFGTGVGSEKASRAGETGFRLYDPIVFSYLKEWLEHLSQLAARETPPELNPILLNALAKTGDGERLASALKDRTHLKDRLRAAHTTFDAFRTLKLVHCLRDTALPDLPWREALMKSGLATMEEVSQDADKVSILLERQCQRIILN